MSRYARDLLYAAVCWRDAARRTHSATFKRLWLRNMRDCALAWREVRKEDIEAGEDLEKHDWGGCGCGGVMEAGNE